METNLASLSRRNFLRRTGIAGVGLAVSETGMARSLAVPARYQGPNVFLIRWGGGARRRESIHPQFTYAPYLTHELVRRGVLFPRMEIAQFEGLNTSHGEGTLNLITGRYDRYVDAADNRPELGHRFLGARFEAKVPTIFEELRQAFAVPEHQALIVNGEDRGDEEFYNFSNHHLFGVQYRSVTLSLRRYKTWLLRRQLESGKIRDEDLEKQRSELVKLESLDYRTTKESNQGEAIGRFWEKWREFYGDSGLANPRGDRLLTELTIRAIQQLRPRLVMVNYQDCDYVHWGYMDHYTRGIAIMDEGLRALVATVESDPEYRDNTLFVVVPDCGRDSNPFIDVPCQHHFGSRSAHEIFALFFGKGAGQGIVVDKKADQTSIAATVGHFMGFKSPYTDGGTLEEAFA